MNDLALDIYNRFMECSHEFDVPVDDFIRLSTIAAEAAEDALLSDEFTDHLDNCMNDLVGLSPKTRLGLGLQMALGVTKEFE